MEAMYWLILLIVLVVIEIITLGLTTIWFAGGALAAFILSMLDLSPLLQWTAFCIVSFLLLFGTRPWALRFFNSQKREKTNVDSLIGKTAVVTAEICNLKGQGEVFAGGLTWMARTQSDDERIGKDAQVEILAVEGVKLIVREKKEGL